jgi:hypothetical protein
MTVDEAFLGWLEGRLCDVNEAKTRGEFAKENQILRSDLFWAFSAGYNRGSQSVLEEFKQ